MKQLNSYIDHTLLKPESTQTDVDHVVQEAIDNHFYSVMIN
ncbi:MAG: 2-deoxyribose-5-phosphate aldolase, partial [Lentilactobacillus hilgardii]